MNKDEIIEASRIHPSRITNIYLYGSRVYETNTPESDYDILLLGSSLVETQEIYVSTSAVKYNIHIHVPNRFEDDLIKHDIHCLECIWAPDYAKIQIKKDYTENFVVDKNKLRIKLSSQSHDSWVKSKIKINDGDLERGYKSLYHSMRILLFGIQILKNGKITDFSEGNYIFGEITNSEQYKWDYFKNKYMLFRRDLLNKFLGNATVA